MKLQSQEEIAEKLEFSKKIYSIKHEITKNKSLLLKLKSISPINVDNLESIEIFKNEIKNIINNITTEEKDYIISLIQNDFEDFKLLIKNNMKSFDEETGIFEYKSLKEYLEDTSMDTYKFQLINHEHPIMFAILDFNVDNIIKLFSEYNKLLNEYTNFLKRYIDNYLKIKAKQEHYIIDITNEILPESMLEKDTEAVVFVSKDSIIQKLKEENLSDEECKDFMEKIQDRDTPEHIKGESIITSLVNEILKHYVDSKPFIDENIFAYVGKNHKELKFDQPIVILNSLIKIDFEGVGSSHLTSNCILRKIKNGNEYNILEKSILETKPDDLVLIDSIFSKLKIQSLVCLMEHIITVKEYLKEK